MYEKGQSKREAENVIGIKAIQANENYKNPNSPRPQKFGLDDDVQALMTHHNIQVWCGCIVKNIRMLDDEVDKLLNEVIVLGDGIFNTKKQLQNKLDELLKLRSSIRNIEIDSEEFVNSISILDHKLESVMGQTVLQILSQLNSSFLTTYNLTTYKLKNITSSRIVLTNIIISITAVMISLCAFTRN